MKQASLKLNLNVKKTRKQLFLEQMEQVVPWAALVELIAPYYPEGKTGRSPFSLQTMLRVHFMQQWFTLSDPAMEEAFFDTPLYREFAQLEEFGRLPDESTVLRFGKTPSPRHRLEKHKLAEQILGVVNEILIQRGLLLKTGTIVDATLIAAPSSTKNKDHKRDPEMHSSKKGEQMYFGMKGHIGTDAKSGLVHTVRETSGNVSDVTEGNSLLHGEETVAFGDAGYKGIEKRPDAKSEVTWHTAMRPGKRRALNRGNAADALIDKAEKIKAGIRAKVQHPFRVIKRQFGFVKVRYRGLKKNTAQLVSTASLLSEAILMHRADLARSTLSVKVYSKATRRRSSGSALLPIKAIQNPRTTSALCIAAVEA
jgi:IS5 family transposase